MSAPVTTPVPASADGFAIEVRGVGREFRRDGKVFAALDGVDLSVRRGELYGLLGRNGAGKTTLIRILTTLLLPSRGSARVAGYEVVGQEPQVRRRINMVSGGESTGYGLLTVEENLWMFAQFYGVPGAVSMRRIDAMLSALDFADQRRSRVDSLSTGMRQKMNVIRGLLTEPQVLFLDEPTLGLDVHAARQIRAYLKEWMAARPDRTVLLTTHYMFEADELCDRIAIIDGGKILTIGTPRELKERQGSAVSLCVTLDRRPDGDLSALPGVQSAALTGDGDGPGCKAHLTLASESAVAGVLEWLLMHKLSVVGLDKHEATLEDVFVALVGKGLEE